MADRPITDLISEGTFAARPAAADALEYYVTTGANAGKRYYSDGATWSEQPPAAASHVHAGEDITSGTVADARVASTLTRDSEAAAAYAALSHAHAGTDITSGTVAAARLPTLDAITAPAADVSMNTHKITGVVDPTSNQHAATKKYVDDTVAASAGDMATDPIWDAAGDLAVGTGANTAAKLALGAAGTVPTSNGTTLANALPPGYEFDYVQITSGVNVTATGSTDAATDLIVSGSSVAYDGSTAVVIEFYAPTVTTPSAAVSILLYLYDGTTSLGIIGQWTAETASGVRSPAGSLRRRLTPSNASHTYKIKAAVNSGTGSVAAGAGGTGAVYVPAFIRITKV